MSLKISQSSAKQREAPLPQSSPNGLEMLFYKPLVSLVTAIALASTVTASATPVRRNDGPQCNPQVQNLFCCESELLGILALGCVLDVLCADGTAVCCDQDVEQHGGLINLNLGCITL
ncbi:hypothetical protein EDB83DRAFT_2683252 [Lactarius deliciosus]|nr:hypothetical protein EDB83DRAFT_2683252 [Lactarius deliciosus]